MSRRVNLPGANELFRPTSASSPEPEPAAAQPERTEPPALTVSGRVRHEEKITIYVSTEELIALEQTRLRLLTEHGLNVDRGRIVRAAIAMAIEETATRGADSGLLGRLTR